MNGNIPERLRSQLTILLEIFERSRSFASVNNNFFGRELALKHQDCIFIAERISVAVLVHIAEVEDMNTMASYVHHEASVAFQKWSDQEVWCVWIRVGATSSATAVIDDPFVERRLRPVFVDDAKLLV